MNNYGTFLEIRSEQELREASNCRFCGHSWTHYGGNYSDCVKAHPGKFDLFSGTKWTYYRTGACYERQLWKLSYELEKLQKKERELLDRSQALRDALKGLHIL